MSDRGYLARIPGPETGESKDFVPVLGHPSPVLDCFCAEAE